MGHTTISTLVITRKNQVASAARSKRAVKVPHSQCSRQKLEMNTSGRGSRLAGRRKARRVLSLMCGISLGDSGKMILNSQCPN
ncbi:hypothetical protein D9M71_408220 [compost metagenome]